MTNRMNPEIRWAQPILKHPSYRVSPQKSLGKLTLLLPLFALLLILSACGAKPTEPSVTQAGNTESVPETAGSDAVNGAAKPEQEPVTLTISAAASLTDALGDIESMYEAAHPYVALDFNFGASGSLQRQIEQGAPVDLFLSASAKNMQALVDGGLIEDDQKTNWLTNTLVVVVPSDSAVAKIEDLTGDAVKHIAMGIPDSVPAGRYAQEALNNAGLQDSLESKLVQGKDVRQVLQYTETGNVDAGFVYKTDALTSDRVKLAFDVDRCSYSPIHYPIGIVQSTDHEAAAQQFYDYLQTPEALDILTGYGFSAAQ